MQLVNFSVFLCRYVVISARIEPFSICCFIWLIFVFEAKNCNFVFLLEKKFPIETIEFVQKLSVSVC